MLFKVTTLEKIKVGQVDLAFRKWKKASVKEGGTLKTTIGLLRIDRILSVSEIKLKDIKRAGYKSLSELEKELSKSSGDILYKIEFHLEGEDPRIALRSDDNLTERDIKIIQSKLRRFDSSKKYPGWASLILETIHNNPGKSAGWISQSLDIDKMWLKPNIRKLKEMGLTISLEVGYKISPRGIAYLLSRRK